MLKPRNDIADVESGQDSRHGVSGLFPGLGLEDYYLCADGKIVFIDV